MLDVPELPGLVVLGLVVLGVVLPELVPDELVCASATAEVSAKAAMEAVNRRAYIRCLRVSEKPPEE
jgi:hypothetical protein